MVQPIQYDISVADPFAATVKGLQLGASVVQAEEANRQLALQRLQQEQALQQAQMVQRAGAALIANPNPTARDFVNYAMLLPKDQAESVRKNFETLEKANQDREIQFTSQLFSALQAKQPDVAKSLLETRIEAERNAGRPDLAKASETMLGIVNANPDAGFKFVGTMLATLPGGDKAIETAIKLNRAPVDLAKAEADLDAAKADAIKKGVDAQFATPLAQQNLSKATSEALTAASDAKFRDQANQLGLDQKNWDIKNLQSQIRDRANKARLDEMNVNSQVLERLANIQDKATSIPVGLQPDMNKAFAASATAKEQAKQYNSLSSRITDIGNAWGSLGSFSEWIKKSMGSQNAVSELRQEYTRLRNSAAISALPPGPATDKDIALAMSGFPTETGDPQIIARFLRGMAKMKDIESSVENARGEWMANNKGLLNRANKAFTAGDFAVNAGETFSDLTNRIADTVSKRYISPTEQQQATTETLLRQIPGNAPRVAAPVVPDIVKEAEKIIGKQ